MRVQKGCVWVAAVAGEAVGDALATAAFKGDAEADGVGVADVRVTGVGIGVGVALGSVVVTADAAFLLEFRFD
jgi:hypothetical protein